MSDAKVQVAKKAFEEMAPQINKESILNSVVLKSIIITLGSYLNINFFPYILL